MCAQVVTAWNGMAIGAFANAGRVLASSPAQRLFPVEGSPAREYLAGAHPGPWARLCRSMPYLVPDASMLRCGHSQPGSMCDGAGSNL
jgi:hypothetical protein